MAASYLVFDLKPDAIQQDFLLKAEVQISIVCLLLDTASVFQDALSLAILELTTGTSDN